MTQNEKQLWERIREFKLDEEGAELTFTDRLARENGWSKSYAQRVKEEYLKFIFLCCVSDAPVTPSDPVDQAWHLHLTYTRSYWEDLCRNTLNRDINHNPTKGGESERQKFDSCYTRLRNIYLEKFDAYPPKDIWEDNATRFNNTNFRRVNLNMYWTVKKPTPQQVKQLLLLIILITIFIIIKIHFVVAVIFIVAFLQAQYYRWKGNDNGNSNGSGCDSSSGFIWFLDSSSESDNGCTADGGCSSGCSGCGGGCGGD